MRDDRVPRRHQCDRSVASVEDATTTLLRLGTEATGGGTFFFSSAKRVAHLTSGAFDFYLARCKMKAGK